MDDVKPRRVPRTIRYGIAAALAVIMALMLALPLRLRVGSGFTTVALVVSTFGLMTIAVLVGNMGFRPRIRGKYLELTTVIGRQSLDLTAITGVRSGRTQSGTITLRLRDDITDVSLVSMVPPPVFHALRQGLWEAAGRGVLVPGRVTRLFNLPAVSGAPRDGESRLPIIAGVIVGMLVLGVAVGLLSSP